MSAPKAPDAWLVEDHLGKTFTFSDERAREGARLWNAHHAEPLYTLPNALRALAEDVELVKRLRLAVNGGGGMKSLISDNLRDLADELDNPEPPMPPEPTGDVKVFDKNDSQWVPTPRRCGRWERVGNSAFGVLFREWSSPKFHREFGPLKIYEAKP
jgi:hypothetical protein